MNPYIDSTLPTNNSGMPTNASQKKRGGLKLPMLEKKLTPATMMHKSPAMKMAGPIIRNAVRIELCAGSCNRFNSGEIGLGE